MEDSKQLNSPVVSIVVPSYNAGDLLGELIECVICQSFTDWELVIIDDGSLDNTYEVACIFEDSRVRVYHRDREPKGAQTCRNLGFAKCRGKYVCFFDADDLISSNCLEQRVRFMESNPNLDFGIFPASVFRQGEDIREISKAYYGLKDENRDPFSSLLMAQYQFLVVTNIYRRNFLLKNHIDWNENVKVYQDFDFNFRTLMSGPIYAFASQSSIDYFYRIAHSTSSISSNFISDEKCESTLLLFERVLKVLSNLEEGKKRKKDFLLFVRLHLMRLAHKENKQQVMRYLQLIKKYYGRYLYTRYSIGIFLYSKRDMCSYGNVTNFLFFYSFQENLEKLFNHLSKFLSIK